MSVLIAARHICAASLSAIALSAGAASPYAEASNVRLSRPASAASIAAVVARAVAAGWRDVTVTQAQSFRMVAGKRGVAALVTGEALLAPDVRGCFAAMVQGGRVVIIPTIGHGDYETTSCGGPVAVGIVSQGSPTGIGIIFRSYSPNAASLEPIAFTWDAATNRFAIDAARSNKASLAGAQSIADMARAIR